MQTAPQPPKNFCDLPRETLELLAASQRRLLESRARSRLPRDRRSEINLMRLKELLKEMPA